MNRLKKKDVEYHWGELFFEDKMVISERKIDDLRHHFLPIKIMTGLLMT